MIWIYAGMYVCGMICTYILFRIMYLNQPWTKSLRAIGVLLSLLSVVGILLVLLFEFGYWIAQSLRSNDEANW